MSSTPVPEGSVSPHTSELARVLAQVHAPEKPGQPAVPNSDLAHGDSVAISQEGLEALHAELSEELDSSPHEGVAGTEELSPEEKEEVRSLAARDREVRAHEEAHKAVAGELASGGPTYEYETGPDDKRYAVGGEVRIRMEEGRTPEETVAIARRIQAAALAPANPSAQDRSVAARAKQMEAEALQELAAERAEAEGDEERVDGEARGTSGVLPPDLFA